MWIIFAITAAVFWGLTYVMQEFLFRYISVTTYLTLISYFTFITLGLAGLYNDTLIQDVRTILTSNKLASIVILAIGIYIIAEICIAYSILGKNASLAGLIEVSYPIFIILFSQIIFKQSHMSLTTIFAGMLIMSGVIIISIKSS